MKRLICTMGLPRSGKTTWCKEQKLGPVVSPDAIRLALHGQPFIGHAEPMVWAITRYMVRSLFEYGYQTVVLDSTMTEEYRRNEWADKGWVTSFKVFETPLEECIKRAGPNTMLVDIINRMYARWEPLCDHELEYKE